MSDVRTTTALTDALAAISRWYPATGQPPRTTVSTTHVAYASKPPMPTDVLSTRRRTRDTLTSLATTVTRERGLHPTTPCARPRPRPVFGPEPRTGWPRVCGCGRQTGQPLIDGRAHGLVAGDVATLASFLARHAAWILDREPGALRATERLATALEQIVKQSRPARVKLGVCPEVGCGGRLVAIVRRSDDVLPSAVRCSLAPRDHVWEPHDWPALGRRLAVPLHPGPGHGPLGQE